MFYEKSRNKEIRYYPLGLHSDGKATFFLDDKEYEIIKTSKFWEWLTGNHIKIRRVKRGQPWKWKVS